jgi:ApbE superfamily uncharacterized protein (UPF0280 family)
MDDASAAGLTGSSIEARKADSSLLFSRSWAGYRAMATTVDNAAADLMPACSAQNNIIVALVEGTETNDTWISGEFTVSSVVIRDINLSYTVTFGAPISRRIFVEDIIVRA